MGRGGYPGRDLRRGRERFARTRSPAARDAACARASVARNPGGAQAHSQRRRPRSMITQEFEFGAPEKLDEELALLADGGDDIKLLSGGMSLMPMMALGLVRPRIVLSLNRIDGRGYVREDRDALRIGAGTRHYANLHDPLIARHCAVLVEAAAFIGDVQVRNRGTIGGSLAHADPAADYSPVLVAAGARVIARSKRGQREIAADKFFTNLMETALKRDEIVTDVIVPKLGAARGAYTRLHRIEGNFPIANAPAIFSHKHPRI